MIGGNCPDHVMPKSSPRDRAPSKTASVRARPILQEKRSGTLPPALARVGRSLAPMDWAPMQNPAQQQEVPPSERITITNEVELEAARLLSVAPPDEFPPKPGTLSLLDDEVHVGFECRDLTGALAVAERILLKCADAEARACADACRARLIARYVAIIGSLERVPVLVAPLADVDAMALDYRAAFVVWQIDGHTSLDAILDVSGMPALETLRIVSELVRREIITFLRPDTTHPVEGRTRHGSSRGSSGTAHHR